ncbi:MAG: hypothetical protein ACO3A2_04620 [Bdellovibrionia bacterium]
MKLFQTSKNQDLRNPKRLKPFVLFRISALLSITLTSPLVFPDSEHRHLGLLHSAQASERIFLAPAASSAPQSRSQGLYNILRATVPEKNSTAPSTSTTPLSGNQNHLFKTLKPESKGGSPLGLAGPNLRTPQGLPVLPPKAAIGAFGAASAIPQSPSSQNPDLKMYPMDDYLKAMNFMIQHGKRSPPNPVGRLLCSDQTNPAASFLSTFKTATDVLGAVDQIYRGSQMLKGAPRLISATQIQARTTLAGLSQAILTEGFLKAIMNQALKTTGAPNAAQAAKTAFFMLSPQILKVFKEMGTAFNTMGLAGIQAEGNAVTLVKTVNAVNGVRNLANGSSLEKAKKAKDEIQNATTFSPKIVTQANTAIAVPKTTLGAPPTLNSSLNHLEKNVDQTLERFNEIHESSAPRIK